MRVSEDLLQCSLLTTNFVLVSLIQHAVLFCSETVCTARICHNGGTCVDNYATKSYTCNCPAQYTGTHCESGKILYLISIVVIN